MVLFNVRPAARFAITWVPKEKIKTTPRVVRITLTGDTSLTIAFCQIRKQKTRNVAIRTEKTKKLNTTKEGEIKNRTIAKGKTSKIPNNRIKGVQIMAGRLFLSKRELKQAAE